MPAAEFQCKVLHRKYLTPTVFEIAFETAAPLSFKAGQFVSVVVPGAGPKGRDLRRAYSIASGPDQRPIELCVKLVEGGPGTNYLNGLNEGDVFRGYAPYGDFTYEPKAGRIALFISTGTGLAPFRSILLSDSYQSQPPKRTLCMLGVRTEDEILYSEEISRMSCVEWIVTVSQPKSDWKGFKGRVTDYIRSLGNDFPWLEADYYLCGNGQMITEVKSILAERGVQKDSIHMEKYY